MRWMIPFTLMFGLAACGGETPTETPAEAEGTEAHAEASDDKASMAAAIAKEIRANPGKRDAILKKHDMTAKDLESLLYEIASDPELSKAYLAALE